jgi:hypothetical protein
MKVSIKARHYQPRASVPFRECTYLKELHDLALGQVAEYFRVLAEPLRLKILNALRGQAQMLGAPALARRSKR